jgi:radical SAM superfamily enzyme YgiQ (UPF0313 family)
MRRIEAHEGSPVSVFIKHFQPRATAVVGRLGPHHFVDSFISAAFWQRQPQLRKAGRF